MTTLQTLRNSVEIWLTKEGLASDFDLIPLAGDGSTRQFFRLKTTNQSFIVLSDPTWTLSQDYPAHQNFLASFGISVPAFFHTDPAVGCLIMEDLGDELLQTRLLEKPKERGKWLENAVELLAQLHGATFPVRPDLPVSTRRFDEKKYFEELCFTLEHLSQKLLGLDASLEDLEKVRAFARSLEGLSPEVFCHRDYHCRNLLVTNEKLVMIDFQDARLGPPHYDLASLLFDAYLPIPEQERSRLLEIYRWKMEDYSLNDAIRWNSFLHDLKLIAFQRTLKAAGSFASFYTRYQKKSHLPYLLPALTSATELQKACSKETSAVADVFPLHKWVELLKKMVI